MKKALVILCITLVVASCQKAAQGDSPENVTKHDTITTPSGLSYYFLKKGTGKKVEHGSAVTSYLSLMVGDKVIWNTDEQPDSLFTYLAGNEEVIKGFEEMGMLLREGDEVVAIMPADIAYGEAGSGQLIPPNSTIVYNQWKVKKVGEPKAFIADTLYTEIKNNGVESAMVRYKMITSSADSTKYHLNERQFSKLWRMLNEEDLNEEAFMAADYFGNTFSHNGLKYSAIISLENMGKYKEAVEAIDALIAIDPNSAALKAKKAELETALTL